jgi:acyl-CoA synthetase (AMP-forming)/AMP-acid ligase II
MGFLPADRVLFSVRPNPDGIALLLGIIGAGGTVVLSEPDMFRARIEWAPGWVVADALLYSAPSGPLRRRGPLLRSSRHLYVGRWHPGVPRTATSVRSLFDTPPRPVEPTVDRHHEALIVFTDDSTDQPKAVVHSRASLGTGLAALAVRARLAPGDRVSADRLMLGIPALIGGAHWRLPLSSSKRERHLDALSDVDVLFTRPEPIEPLLQLLDADPSRVPRLRAILIEGAAVPRPLLERVELRWPQARVLAVDGMTEVPPIAIADAKPTYDGRP